MTSSGCSPVTLLSLLPGTEALGEATADEPPLPLLLPRRNRSNMDAFALLARLLLLCGVMLLVMLLLVDCVVRVWLLLAVKLVLMLVKDD